MRLRHPAGNEVRDITSINFASLVFFTRLAHGSASCDGFVPTFDAPLDEPQTPVADAFVKKSGGCLDLSGTVAS